MGEVDREEGDLCTLRGPPGRPGVSSHRDGLGVSDHVLQVGGGALELPAIDGLGGFSRVLEGDAEVGAAGAGGLRGLEVGGCVADLGTKEVVVSNEVCWRVSGGFGMGCFFGDAVGQRWGLWTGSQ